MIFHCFLKDTFKLNFSIKVRLTLSSTPATSLIPLLNHMPWDAINLGNHEAYHTDTLKDMKKLMVPHFGQSTFVTSNIEIQEEVQGDDTTTTEMHVFGQRYKKLVGVNNTLMVFGFLYDMTNPSQILDVKKVEEVVNQGWFERRLKNDEYDAILILAHMDNKDPLIHVILSAIRKHVGEDMPVQFITGHTHLRAFEKVDLWSYAFEAGGNLDTVGFVSFPTQKTAQSVLKREAKTLFRNQFLNPSKKALTHAWDPEAKISDLPTENGTALTRAIKETQHSLGLDQIVACPPHDYYRNASMFSTNSIWKLWKDHVVPTQVFKTNAENSAMMISSNNWRYDIRTRKAYDAITVDDVVAIAPFMDSVVHVGKVPVWVIRRMNSSLNTYSMHNTIPDFVLVADLDATTPKDLQMDFYTHEYNVPEIVSDLERLNVANLRPKRTGERDTLYWLHYFQQAWPCEQNKPNKVVKPWFENLKKLEEEESDGKRGNSESFDDEIEDIIVENGEKEKGKGKGNGEHAGGNDDSIYQGYLPPATYEQYKEHLPPAAAPNPIAPTRAPVSSSSKINEAIERQKHKKKLRKKIFKGIALLIALSLLLTPLICCLLSLTGRLDDDDDIKESFYDPEEMMALRQRGKNNREKANQGLMPSEIELT